MVLIFNDPALSHRRPVGFTRRREAVTGPVGFTRRRRGKKGKRRISISMLLVARVACAALVHLSMSHIPRMSRAEGVHLFRFFISINNG